MSQNFPFLCLPAKMWFWYTSTSEMELFPYKFTVKDSKLNIYDSFLFSLPCMRGGAINSVTLQFLSNRKIFNYHTELLEFPLIRISRKLQKVPQMLTFDTFLLIVTNYSHLSATFDKFMEGFSFIINF